MRFGSGSDFAATDSGELHNRQTLASCGRGHPGLEFFRFQHDGFLYEILITFLATSGFAFQANGTGCRAWIYRKSRVLVLQLDHHSRRADYSGGSPQANKD